MEHKNVMDDKSNCPTSPNLRVAICWYRGTSLTADAAVQAARLATHTDSAPGRSFSFGSSGTTTTATLFPFLQMAEKYNVEMLVKKNYYTGRKVLCHLCKNGTCIRCQQS